MLNRITNCCVTVKVSSVPESVFQCSSWWFNKEYFNKNDSRALCKCTDLNNYLILNNAWVAKNTVHFFTQKKNYYLDKLVNVGV